MIHHCPAAELYPPGSADVLMVPQLSDSLTGRVPILEPSPLSPREIRGCRERFVDALFDRPIQELKPSMERGASRVLASESLRRGRRAQANDRLLTADRCQVAKESCWRRRQTWVIWAHDDGNRIPGLGVAAPAAGRGDRPSVGFCASRSGRARDLQARQGAAGGRLGMRPELLELAAALAAREQGFALDAAGGHAL